MMEDFKLIHDAGLAKINFFEKFSFRFFMKSFMAGCYLGVAMILSLSLGSIIGTIDPLLSKIAFSLFFGLTFVMIIFLNGELFTGNCLTTIFPIFSKRKSLPELLKMWLICLLGNSVGVMFVSVLFTKSGALSEIVLPYVSGLVQGKLNYEIGPLLIKSVLCNFIVCIATYVALKVKDEMAKTVIMLLVITTFVITGFDHCIANIGLFTIQGAVDLAAMSGSAVAGNLVLSIIGNVLGGSGMLAIPLYLILREPAE